MVSYYSHYNQPTPNDQNTFRDVHPFYSHRLCPSWVCPRLTLDMARSQPRCRPGPAPAGDADETASNILERSLYKRTEPNWSNYIDYSTNYMSYMGQNIALLAIPAHRALCPDQLEGTQACVGNFNSPCENERVLVEWCYDNRYITLLNPPTPHPLTPFKGSEIAGRNRTKKNNKKNKKNKLTVIEMKIVQLPG